MRSLPTATMVGSERCDLGMTGPHGVVELALLLPSTRAEALAELARHRRESVGQVLRSLIDRALAAPND